MQYEQSPEVCATSGLCCGEWGEMGERLRRVVGGPRLPACLAEGLPCWSGELVVPLRSRPLYPLKGRPPEPGCRSAEALGVLASSQSSLFEAESSRRGKAGALWETAFPLLHPLPSPRSTPSLGGRGEPCFRLLPAFGKSREDRFLPASPSRVSHGPCALARRAGSCFRALTPRAFSVPRVSGGSASRNCQRKRRLPARGLGASRRGVEAVHGGEIRANGA